MTYRTSHTPRKVLAFSAAAALLLGACSLAAAEPTPTPTPPATNTPVPTNTPEPTATNTPEPTATNTPEPTPTPTETFTPTPDLAATAAYESTQAAAEVEGLVHDILAVYNISPDSGYLAWNEPNEIPVVHSTGGGGIFFREIDEGVVYNNYVLHTNLTWDSDTGLAGCGIIFHSEPNLEQGQQYQFAMLRLSGAPGWDVELWQYGTWQSTTTGELKFNNAIDLGNGATNEVVLVIMDGLMTAYVNQVRLSNVIISTRGEGRVAYFLFQESGQTSCVFSDNWIWVLEE